MTQPTTSPARIAANQANAQLSTGPTTTAGKVASRANALKHGLTARVVGLEEIEESPLRLDNLAAGWDVAWYTAQMFRTMAQLDRLARIETYARAEAARRAKTVWKEDQQAAVETLGLKLGRRPSWVVSELMRTPSGCIWLMVRWELLEQAASAGVWDEKQNKLAFDLLGIPAELRVGSVSEVASGMYATDGQLLTQIEVARNTLDMLQERFDLMLEADAHERGIAAAGLVDLPTAELARLRRYEAMLRKYLDSLLVILQFGPPAAPPDVPAPPAETPTATTPPSSPVNVPPIETNPTRPVPSPESTLPEPTFPTSDPLEPTKMTSIHQPEATEPNRQC